MVPMWHEGLATKTKKLMKIGGKFVSSVDQLILKSPCIYVGNPLYKCPDEDCSAKEEFEEIDLERIPANYFPRTNLQTLVPIEQLRAQSPSVPWAPETKHVDYFRIAFRGRVQPARERTLAAALIPPGIHHVDGMESMSFEKEEDLVATYPLMLSIPHDFLIKSMQVEKVRGSVVRYLPFAAVDDTAKLCALQLGCLTAHYAEIWNRNAPSLKSFPWSLDDARLPAERPTGLQWTAEVALRNEFARRYALIEIDVLVAQALGLTIDQLVSVYKAQFPVLAENEAGTWYDRNGRIVWTCAMGLTGVGYRKKDGKKPTSREWTDTYANLAPGTCLECEVDVDFLSSGPQKIKRTYVAPFVTFDREADYRRAWAFFEAQSRQKAA